MSNHKSTTNQMKKHHEIISLCLMAIAVLLFFTAVYGQHQGISDRTILGLLIESSFALLVFYVHKSINKI